MKQVQINDYAYGIWFNIIRFEEDGKVIVVYDHVFQVEQKFLVSDNLSFREIP